MARSITIEHLTRIEGHAGITVWLEGGRVERVDCDVFEGIRLFEELVRGRTFADVPGIVSRVCAICSHGHTVTALLALEQALGVEVSAQTRLLRDLAYQGSNIESHALHVFFLALPDFLGHPSALSLASEHPEAVRLALRLKRLGNTIQEVVGGRAVHPVNYVVGGFGKLPTIDQLLDLKQALTVGVEDYKRAVDLLRMVAVPAFVDEPIRAAALVPEGEAFFFGDRVRLSDGPTVPVTEYRRLTNEHSVGHSHARHSLHDGRSFMVGALARLALHADRLPSAVRGLWQYLCPTMPARNIVLNTIAQTVELVYSIDHALALVSRLLDSGLTEEAPVPPSARGGQGTAATEVPRGTLYHHYQLGDAGEVLAADIITPTAQNLANLEGQLAATVRDAGIVGDRELQHRLEMVARAYDPCVSCSVHAIEAR